VPAHVTGYHHHSRFFLPLASSSPLCLGCPLHKWSLGLAFAQCVRVRVCRVRVRVSRARIPGAIRGKAPTETCKQRSCNKEEMRTCSQKEKQELRVWMLGFKGEENSWRLGLTSRWEPIRRVRS